MTTNSLHILICVIFLGILFALVALNKSIKADCLEKNGTVILHKGSIGCIYSK